ncbi:alpha/beta fold hydrolase [Streptomyces sp. NPDC051994]|uniref:alpha/beta fold hydrolase n=1 Tax=unclassified Streptomyces TaxID=2593676 RepID=UPI00341759FB
MAGYSLGGLVAMRAAARHPERVTALVLTATLPYYDNRLALATPIWAKLAETDRELLPKFLVMMAMGADALEYLSEEQLRQALEITAANIADGTPEHAELAGRADVRDDLPHIKAPTLVPPPRTGSPPPASTGRSPTRSPAPSSWRSPPGTCPWSSAPRSGRR